MSSVAALPPNTTRWVASRKAALVAAVHSGEISLEEACQRYQLSVEEFSAWERAFKTYGVQGLQATCLQRYRKKGTHFSQSANAALASAIKATPGLDLREADGPAARVE